MELTAKRLPQAPEDRNHPYQGFNVCINDHRILTVSTSNGHTANRWLKEVLKTPCLSKNNPLIVGIAVDHCVYYSNGPNSPYDLLQICTGSHCLLFHLDSCDFDRTPRYLRTFFTDPCVIAVGVEVEKVSKKLETENGIVFGPKTVVLDVKQLAVKVLKRPDLDLERYDFDKLVDVILGKRMAVDRPKRPVSWWSGLYDQRFRSQKAKFATVDPYLCYMIGKELLFPVKLDVSGLSVSANTRSAGAASSSKEKKKKEEKTKKKK